MHFVQSVDKVATPAVPSVVRDRGTLLLYATLGVLGYLLNGLGAVLDPLKRQLHVDRAAVAFYPSLFAVALVVVGLFVGRLVERLGHRFVLCVGIVSLAGGAALLAAPVRVLTLLGAVLLGVGGALLVQVIPAALMGRHPRDPAVVFGEANAVSSWASVLAPAAVAAAVGLQAGWWVGYTLPILPIAAYLLWTLRRNGLFAPVDPGIVVAARREVPVAGLEPGPLLGRWVDVLLSVSVEFCLVFWAADALRDWHDAGPAAAPALATAFLVGMAVGRTFAARVMAGRHPLSIVVGACTTALLGFAAFWGLPVIAGAALGLLVAGAGVSLLYPVTLARLLAAWPLARDRAAARGALASGIAIGVPPFLLARLADATGLRVAYLIVPILLVTLALHAMVGLGRAQATQTRCLPDQPSPRDGPRGRRVGWRRRRFIDVSGTDLPEFGQLWRVRAIRSQIDLVQHAETHAQANCLLLGRVLSCFQREELQQLGAPARCRVFERVQAVRCEPRGGERGFA